MNMLLENNIVALAHKAVRLALEADKDFQVEPVNCLPKWVNKQATHNGWPEKTSRFYNRDEWETAEAKALAIKKRASRKAATAKRAAKKALSLIPKEGVPWGFAMGIWMFVKDEVYRIANS